MTARNLAIALAVQLVLVAVAWWPRDPGVARPLLDVPRDAIERIEIAARPLSDDETPDPAVLVKAEDTWRVESAAGYPASSAEIDELLDALAALEVGPAIAGSPSSHEALGVGEESYGRRVAVTAGGESRAWLLGAATSRSVNVRREGEDDVYRARGASEWSFRDDSASYLDSTYVAADPSVFAAVSVRNEGGELIFEQAGGEWTLAGLAPDERADSDAIAAFVAQLSRVRMTRPVGREVLPEQGLSEGARVSWRIVAEDQSVAGGYAIGAEVEGDRYLKAEGDPFVVRVRESAVRETLDARRDAFVRAEGAAGDG